MSGPGITPINSGPLIIRSYNDITGKNNHISLINMIIPYQAIML